MSFRMVWEVFGTLQRFLFLPEDIGKCLNSFIVPTYVFLSGKHSFVLGSTSSFLPVGSSNRILRCLEPSSFGFLLCCQKTETTQLAKETLGRKQTWFSRHMFTLQGQGFPLVMLPCFPLAAWIIRPSLVKTRKERNQWLVPCSLAGWHVPKESIVDLDWLGEVRWSVTEQNTLSTGEHGSHL